MLYFKANSTIFIDEKHLALLNTKQLGTSNLVTIFRCRNCITSVSLITFKGIASVHLEKESVAVRIYLCNFDEFRFISPTTSNPHCSKGMMKWECRSSFSTYIHLADLTFLCMSMCIFKQSRATVTRS